jgi:cytochrome c biogenesis protein CcmG/thiol:disulfide interchange protein DsbE
MGVLAVVALLGFGLATKGDGGVEIGEPPPETALPVLDPTASGSASLADFEGEWVLANLWASWCEPCREESPALNSFARRNKREVTVVGINTQDNTDDALEFVDEFALTYDQLHDGSGDYADELGATGVPETVLVDPEGNVTFHFPGAVTEDVLSGQIEPVIRGDA